jgi:ubiquinone/menaquinone biosynthesis C-methylase UbiE
MVIKKESIKMRNLEIGPGKMRVQGFETFNLGDELKSDGGTADHQGDARDLSRFDDNTFRCVYSSHCIEHVHWYEVQDTIKEWARVISPGGTLEVWTVNGFLVMQELIALETTGKTNKKLKINWQSDKTKQDPYLWLVGKLYNYTKTPGVDFDYQLHRALITPEFLKKCFVNANLKNVRTMSMEENRLRNRHGWINMGVIGTK